jgi:hypothetical protein
LPKPIDLGKLHAIITYWIKDRLSDTHPVEEIGPSTTAGARTPESAGARPDAASTIKRNGGDGMNEEEIRNRLRTYFIDGLDLAKGLARYENKESIYLPLLKSFIRHSPVMLDELRNPTAETIGNYAIKVHGFKGACAGICADKAADLALALEMSAKKPDLQAVLKGNDEFIAAAESLIRELVILLRNFPIDPVDDTREVRPSPDINILKSLALACQYFKNSEIKKNIEKLESFEYQEDGELVEWLRDQAENIEYEAITEHLKQYISKRNQEKP